MAIRILAVDDSETMRGMVRQTLEIAGYEVDLANDGEEGAKVFSQNKYDLVISDVNMPIMDGITMIREIRKIDQDVPILTLTTESEDEMKQKGKDAGANGWIVKPFRPAQFLDIIRQILS